MDKKAQSISINTIIIAAMGLAVLVILFAILTGRIGLFSQGLQETDTCVQKCNSLNLLKKESLDSKDCSELESSKFIPGKYKDAPDGCCCLP